jgi:hypothetical protein
LIDEEVAWSLLRPGDPPGPDGSDIVTWAELVEAGFLREYRARRVSLQYLRPVIDEMRRQ